jgi:signal transduction histidine kinase
MDRDRAGTLRKNSERKWSAAHPVRGPFVNFALCLEPLTRNVLVMSAVPVPLSVSRHYDGTAHEQEIAFHDSPTVSAATATAARIKRAKERLYVLCQVGGWGVFWATQHFFSQAFSSAKTEAGPVRDALTDNAIFAMVVLLGLLLTHYSRLLMQHWGWKQLAWRALVPRVFAMSLSLAVVWIGASYLYPYGMVGIEWTSKLNIWLVFAISCLNGAIIFVVWLGFYFFYHVFERLNRLQIEQLQLAANVKEAELRALKSQLNPHFLFNSLNSLRALIDEDAARAREAVTRLSNMLRYSLQSGQLETVPFEDELRIVEDYLALESIRHESRLRVRWEIMPDAALVNVPPMLLQTLVENAVKYGISSRREGGEVFIRAWIEGAPSQLHISVTNPGDLNAPLSHSAARAGSSTGVGLRNASERLKLLFGDRASLGLRSESAGFVTADVCIPL